MKINRAVMENTGGLDLGDEGAETALYRRLSYFPTPPWAARAGIEIIDSYGGRPMAKSSAWDPAAGRLHLVHALRDSFGTVHHSDIHDYGVGSTVADFLMTEPTSNGPDWIITNPPFPRAAEFAARGLQVAQKGVALLCRLSLLESVGRHALMTRLTALAPFSERVAMQMGSWDPGLSTATAYAWFIWHRHQLSEVPHVRMIPPGTKARLTRESDEAFADGRPA